MGHDTKLTSADGFEFDAYYCEATGETRGGVIVVQEIFGVNDHIRCWRDNLALKAEYDVLDHGEEGKLISVLQNHRKEVHRTGRQTSSRHVPNACSKAHQFHRCRSHQSPQLQAAFLVL